MITINFGEILMPVNQKNINFTNNPLQFLHVNPVINNQNADSAVFGKCYEANAKLRSAAATVLNYIDQNCTTVDLDFVPFRVGPFSGLLPRYVLRPYLDQMYPNPVPGLMATKVQFLAGLPQDPPNCVRGYYFPYKTGRIHQVNDMGWVDIPKQTPIHKFAFTGAMNGCGIIVTTPSGNPNVLRVYHYQNEGINLDYLPLNVRNRQRDGTYSNGRGDSIPGMTGRIHYWFHQGHYQGTVAPNDEVAGFNFLHYAEDNHWWLYSLPMRMDPLHATPISGNPLIRSSKEPFRVRISY